MEKWLDSIYSDGTRYYVSNPYPKKCEDFTVYIRMLCNSHVKTVFLRTMKDGCERLFPMEVDRVDNNLEYRCCKVAGYEDVFHYHFMIITEDTLYYYNQMEITTIPPDEVYDFRILCSNRQPAWVKESVFYQIFPDRFYNGDSSLDVKDDEYDYDGKKSIRVQDWDSEPKRYHETHCMDFYGGDLIGVKKKIPYLKELGVTAIYMNPIFWAPSVHRYDCLDYSVVDPHLGGDKALKELMEELHKNGMKLILDISINHTGCQSKWFNRDGIFYDKKFGAYNNKNAAEREFYFIEEKDGETKYHGWFGVDTLPTLNYTSSKLRDKLYRNRDSIIKKWIEAPYKIDGWRFDVAEMMARKDDLQLHHEVWPEINKSIKDVNPKAYILGESWCDCNEFLHGDEWDSAMNYYGFTKPVREFTGEVDIQGYLHEAIKNVKKKMTAHELKVRIMHHLAKLPTVIQDNQFNLLDSHDAPRLHNRADISFEDYRGAVIMLFTMKGAPSIYYGDEAAIDGRDEDVEGCRFPMPWSRDFKEDKQYKLYSRLAHLKNTIEALKFGGFKIISDDNYVFSYARFTHDELWVTVYSTDDEERIIDIPIDIFGKTHFSCSEDVLGTPIKYTIKDGCFSLTVEPHKSYLIGF